MRSWGFSRLIGPGLPPPLTPGERGGVLLRLSCVLRIAGAFVLGLVSVSGLAGADPAPRHRVIVSSDIGGTDQDDNQSMAHVLLYADTLELEGLIASPYGPGRMKDILGALEAYEKDFATLRTHSPRYPTPAALRAITKQGASDAAGDAGCDVPSDGSQWIIACARREDPRPLWVLVWGGLDDVAQALHDAPDIRPKLRVYWVGGPNKKWSANAYNYIERHHRNLWIIEANSTYTGWFLGGNQEGPWGNAEFIQQHVAGHGALGDYLASYSRGTMKMGDTPSVAYVLSAAPEDPAQPHWGGSFIRAWERPRAVFDRLTTPADRVEVYGIVDIELPRGHGMTVSHRAHLAMENQMIPGFVDPQTGVLRFRFSPKAARTWNYTIYSDLPALDGKTGAITSFLTPPESAQHPAADHPNWWTDNPAPELAQGGQHGAKTVSRWREEFLRDFAARMERCKASKP